MKTTTRLLLGLATWALLQHPAQSFGLCYSVKGKFSYQVFALQKHGDALPTEPLLREFEVLLDECAWKIRVVLVGNTNFDSFVYSYDGTNLFHNAIPASARASGAAMPSVTVEPSPVPSTRTSAAGEYLWLAFASGRYFKGQTNNLALSFGLLRSKLGFEKRHEVPCRVELSSSPPYLPTTIDYIATNRAAFLQDDGTLGALPLPPSFGDGGYTNAVFTSGGFTNVQGLWFPTQFEYRAFKPKTDPPTPTDLNCLLIVRGEVTSISTKQQAVDRGLPNRSFMIYDLRVPEPNVLYAVHDGQIPPVDSEIVRVARATAAKRVEPTLK